MSIAPANPSTGETVERDEISEKVTGSETQIENARSLAITEDEDDEDFEFTFGKFIACCSFMIGICSDVFILTVGSAIINTVAQDLGASSHNSTWFINAQNVSTAVLAPMVGRLSDIFGRRNFFLLGNAISVVGAALAAKSTSFAMGVVGTTLLGSASAMHQIAFAAISEVVPKKSRPLAQGIFQTALGLSGGFAPLIAYALIQHNTWRTAYWLAFAMNAAGFIAVLFFYHPQNQYIIEEGKTKLDQLKSLDFLGLFTFTAGLVLFLVGLSFGGGKYPWKSAGTLAPMMVGIALLIFNGVYEYFNKSPYALFPRQIFSDIRGFTVILGVVFLMGMLYYSTAVLWPIQVQILYATDLIKIGAYSGAFTMASIPFGPILGIIFQKFAKHGRWIFASWVAAVTLFSGLQAIVTPNSNIASTIMVSFCGIFVAAGTLASTSMAQLGVPHEYIGVASLMLVTARTVGGSVATTVYTTILQNDIKDKGAPKIAMAVAKAGLPLDKLLPFVTALLAQDTHSPVLLEAAAKYPAAILAGIAGIKDAYAHAFRLVYLVSIAFGGLGTICALFSLNVGHLLTRHVDITLDEGAHIKTHEGNRKGHVIMHH